MRKIHSKIPENTTPDSETNKQIPPDEHVSRYKCHTKIGLTAPVSATTSKPFTRL